MEIEARKRAKKGIKTDLFKIMEEHDRDRLTSGIWERALKQGDDLATTLVDRAVKAAVLDRVDHYDLSATVPALAGVITTGENLARPFWEWLEGALPPGSLRRVTLVETANNVFEYRGESAPAR